MLMPAVPVAQTDESLQLYMTKFPSSCILAYPPLFAVLEAQAQACVERGVFHDARTERRLPNRGRADLRMTLPPTGRRLVPAQVPAKSERSSPAAEIVGHGQKVVLGGDTPEADRGDRGSAVALLVGGARLPRERVAEAGARGRLIGAVDERDA